MRYLFIDNLRGLAFIFMVIHHIFYFKDVSNDYTTSYANNILVSSSGTIARTLFIFLVGLSLSLSNNNKEKRFKRSLEILLHGMLITFFTYMYFPNYFVRFGVLHFIAVGSLLGSYFVDNKNITMIMMLLFLLIKPISFNNSFIDLIFGTNTTYNMMDYFPLFPWFGLILFGLYIGQTTNLDKVVEQLSKISNGLFNKENILTKIGKNCLDLYTGHIVLLLVLYNIKKSISKN